MLPRRIRADGFVEPCIPSGAPKPPSGPGWVHEIKHDGYRLIVRRDGTAVRLFTRRGYDWTDRYPAIANAAAKLRASCSHWTARRWSAAPMDVAVFDALHRRGRVSDAILQAFDLLELDGVDYRPLAQGSPGAAAGPRAGRDRAQRAHRRRRRGRVSPCLCDGARGHCVEAAYRTLQVRTVPGLDQGQEPG
jgi:hypothetical protein